MGPLYPHILMSLVPFDQPQKVAGGQVLDAWSLCHNAICLMTQRRESKVRYQIFEEKKGGITSHSFIILFESNFFLLIRRKFLSIQPFLLM